MPSILIADVSRVLRLSNTLNDQRKVSTPTFCDVLLKVAGHTLPVHSCVLVAASPFFQRLLVDGPRLGHVPWVVHLEVPELQDGSEEGVAVLQDLLDYVYTGKIEVEEEGISVVMRMAQTFMLHELCGVLLAHDGPPGPGPDVAGTVPGESGYPADYAGSKPDNVGYSLDNAFSVPGEDESVPDNAGTIPDTTRPRKRRQTKKLPDGIIPSKSKRKRRVVQRSPAPPPSAAAVPRYHCKPCRFSASELDVIKEHKRLHANSRNFACRTCGFYSGRCARLLAHLLATEHPEESRCSLCDYVAVDHQQFVQHLQRHGEDPRKPFFCVYCAGRYQYLSFLDAHMASHAKKLTANLEKRFTCHECGFRTAFKRKMRQHERQHKAGLDKNFICEYEGCAYRTYSRHNMLIHGRTHTKEKPFECDLCGTKFSQKCSLQQHLLQHDKEANLLHCHLCTYGTVSRANFSRHMRQMHGVKLATKTEQRELDDAIADSLQSMTESQEATLFLDL